MTVTPALTSVPDPPAAGPDRPPVTQVEVHVSHACNFTCESCSHFSQDGHGGRLTVAAFLREVGPWGRRLLPRYVLLLGGEPLLNPDVCDLLAAARGVWPEEVVRIYLVTNGFLLHRHPALPEALRANRVRLDISKHHDAPAYREKFEAAVALARSWGVEPVIRDSFRDWTRIYKGGGAGVLPYADGDPQASWHRCVSKWCMQLHGGYLYKCPPVAYIGMQVAKFGLDPEGPWAPWLKYAPLAPDCTEAELRAFIARKCESVCALCPARPEAFRKSLPLR